MTQYKVLVIESDDTMKALINEILEGVGVDAVFSESCEAGFKTFLESGPFALVILDWQRYQGSCMGLFQDIRMVDPKVQRLLMVDALFNDGEVSFCAKLVKPIDVDAFTDRIKHCLDVYGRG